MYRLTYMIFAAVMMSAVSCSTKTEVEESGVMMDFDASAAESQIVSRMGSNINNQAALKTDGNQFAVYATYSVSGGAEQQVFDVQPQQVTYSGTSGAWTYSPKKQWMYSADYKFRAVYPASAAVLSTSSSSDLLTVEYNTASYNYDLLVSYVTRSPYNDADKFNKVSMNFRHALAGVCFKIKYADDTVPSTATGHVERAYMKNLYPLGTLLYGKTDASSDVNTMKWHVSYFETVNNLYEWTMSGSTGKEFGVGDSKMVTIYDGDGVVFVVPQQVAADTTTFNFFTHLGGSQVNSVAIPAITWEAGKIYTYTITVTSSKIDITVSIKDWNNIKSNVDIYA